MQAQMPTVQLCQTCQAQLRQQARFCDSCGTPVGQIMIQPVEMQPLVKMRLCDIDRCQSHAVGKCDFRYNCTKGCDKCFCSDHRGSGTCLGRMEANTC